MTESVSAARVGLLPFCPGIPDLSHPPTTVTFIQGRHLTLRHYLRRYRVAPSPAQGQDGLGESPPVFHKPDDGRIFDGLRHVVDINCI